MSILRCLVVCCGLVAAGVAGAAGPPASATPGWAAEVDARVLREMQASGIPGAQIAIAENGRVVYARAYGVADVESRRPVRNETLFQVGSVAKTYTGVLLAQLASEGAVDLKAPISRYVPELAGRRVGKVTAHDLLTHTAGWFDHAEPFGRTDGAAAGDALRAAPDTWVFGPPGRVFSYSNNGFSMAGYVAERAAGMPFAELMQKHVLAGISRDHATYHPLVAMTRDFSLGHVEAPGGDAVVQRPMPGNSAEYGAGFLYSTAADLARMGIVLMSEGMLDGARVLHRDAVARVTGRYIPIPGTPGNRSGYGLQVDRVGGEPVWRKSGNVNGFSSNLSMWPDRQLAVAISINRLDSTMPVDTTVRVAQIVGKTGAPAPRAQAVESDGTAAERSAVAGRYSSGAGVVEIADRAGQLVWLGARGTYPMRFVAPDRLLLKAPAARGREFVVLRDAIGKVEFLHSNSRAWVRQRP